MRKKVYHMEETIGQRILKVRKALGFNMEQFGERIGVTKGSVNNIEKDRNMPSQVTIRSICREFNVDYTWLTEGIGDDMFITGEKSKIDRIIEEYGLSEKERPLVEGYLNAPESVRRQVADYLNSIVEREIAKRQKEKQDK